MSQDAPARTDSQSDTDLPDTTIAMEGRAILQASPDCIIVVDHEGRIIDFNPAAEATFGYRREQVLGRRIVDTFMPGALREAFERGFNHHLQTGESRILGRRVEMDALRWDGSVFPAELTVVRLPGSGAPLFAGFLRDITDTKHRIATQEAIRNILAIMLQPTALEERLGRLLDALFSIPWLRLQSKGAVFLAVKTDGKQELLMAAHRNFPDAQLAGCARVAFGRCLCGQAAFRRKTVFSTSVDEAHEINYDGMAPHGHYCLPVLFTDELLAVLTLYVDGGHQRNAEEEMFLASVADVMAGALRRDKMSESLRTSEERFDLAVRGSDAGIWDWDLRTGTLYYSPRAKSILGYNDDEIGDQFSEWESRLHPEDHERALKTLHDYLAGQIPDYEIEHRLQHKDGSYRWILTRGAALRDAHGKAYRMVGGNIDITARMAAEELLRQNAFQLLAAQKIQEAILPTVAPSLGWLDVAGSSHPAAFAGGDYFDYLPMSSGTFGVVVGDVSGHGFAPALLMASAQAFLRCLTQVCVTLGEIVFRINNFIAGETDSGDFITQVLVRLDPETQSLTYINAGHPSGYVLDSAGCVTSELTTSGPPLGIVKDYEYSTLGPVTLDPGDILVLLTDGILEAASPHDELFGSQRALDAVRQSREKTAMEIVEDLMSAVAAFSGAAEFDDDRTALVVKAVS
jgi:PAS domain S-box-containing protein